MTETLSLTPEISEKKSEVGLLLKRANEMKVRSAQEHAAALEFYQSVNKLQKGFEDLFEEPKKKAFEAKRALDQALASIVDPCKEAKAIASRKATDYQVAQETAARKADEERTAKARKEAEDRKLTEAATLESAGFHESAEAVLEEPVEVVIAKAPTKTAKVEGVSTTTRWSAEVVDKKAFVKFVAENPALLHLVDVNMKGLNQLAIALKEGMNKDPRPYPGVKAVSTSGLSSR